MGNITKDKNNNYAMADRPTIICDNPNCKNYTFSGDRKTIAEENMQFATEIKELNLIIDTKLEELITATGLINQLTGALDAANISSKVFQTKIKEQKVEIMRLHNGINSAISVNNIRQKLVS